MFTDKIKISILSVYIIIALITSGFIGFLIIEEYMEIGNASAVDVIVDPKGGGDYTKIQYAIDNASTDYTILIWAGLYIENLVITKPLTLAGNGSSLSIINGTGSGDVIYINSDAVKIRGLTINGSGSSANDAGIELYQSRFCIIENCNISDNEEGLHLSYSPENVIRNNTFYDNDRHGIYATMGSSKNYIHDNICLRNTFGGISLYQAGSNTVASNNCSDNINPGISLGSAGGNKIVKNTFYNNMYGIQLYQWASNNNFFNNLCYKNTQYGLYIRDSDPNRFYNTKTTYNLRGIYFDNSDGNKFINAIIRNNDFGTYFRGSPHNYFVNCTITSNSISDNYLRDNSMNTVFLDTKYNTFSFSGSNSQLLIKNYLHIQLNDTNSLPVAGGDVEIKDNNLIIYRTSGFGGSSPGTNIDGQLKWIIVTDRYYSDTTTPIENITTVSCKKDGRLFKHHNNGNINMFDSHFEYFTINSQPDKIVPQSPLNDSCSTNATPKFIWNAGSDSDGDSLKYKVEVDNYGGDFTPVLASTVNYIGMLNWEIPTPLEDGAYQWRVCANDGLENGPWSDTWTFAIDNLLPKAAKPDAFRKYNTTGAIKWYWPPSEDTGSGIAGYHVYVGTGPEENDIVDGAWTNNTWYEATGLEDGNNYYCRIQSQNRAGTISDYSKPSDGVLVDKDVPVPTLPVPTREYNNTGAILWRWAPVADTGSRIDGYYVTITRNSERSIVAENIWTTNNWYSMSGLAERNVYYCKIKAKNGAGTVSDNSSESIGVLVDLTAPSKPESVTVTPDTWTNINTFSVSWYNPYDFSDIAGVYYKLYSPPASNTDGTFILSDNINSIKDIKIDDDGEHFIYLWLLDKAGNVYYLNYGEGVLHFDKSAPPPPNNVIVEPAGWSSDDLFTINWVNPVDLSGIKTGVYYSISTTPPTSNANGTFTPLKPIVLKAVNNGETNVYLWLKDVLGHSDYFNYSVAVLKYDNTPPTINHTPLKQAVKDKELIFHVEAKDDLSGLGDATLFYKTSQDGSYVELPMDNLGFEFRITIPADVMTGTSFSYYIRAYDGSSPGNVIYFGADGETDEEPTSSSDIDMIVSDDRLTTTDLLSSDTMFIGIIGIILFVIILIVIFAFMYFKRKKVEDAEFEEGVMKSTSEVVEEEFSTAPPPDYGGDIPAQGQAPTPVPEGQQPPAAIPTPAPEGTQAPQAVPTAQAPAQVPAPAVPPSSEAAPALPQAAHRKCPVCQSILSDENKCGFCSWQKE
jgi:parallel beta-helix repeat protein